MSWFEKAYVLGKRWFLEPGHDWRTWIGHSFVVLVVTWAGFLCKSEIPGITIIGFYFWRELLEQALPKLLSHKKIDVIDSWFDVFIPFVLYIVSLNLWRG